MKKIHVGSQAVAGRDGLARNPTGAGGLALVSGASGFIGQALCLELQRAGWRVRAVVRRPADGGWHQRVLLDLGRAPVPDTLMRGVDCVFHLAGRAHALAEGPEACEEYRLANVQSTTDLLSAARAAGVRAFVFFSSVKAMEPRAQSADWVCDAAYGRSKLLAERAVLSSGAVPHPVVLRPALVYGPHPKGYLELLIRATRARWFPPLPELGNQRSMIHRDDLVRAALLCAADPRARARTYVVTDGSGYSTRQIYDCVLAALDRPAPRWTLPIALLRLAALAGDGIGRLRHRRFPFDSEVLEKLVDSACYDGTPIRQELGFEPRRTLQDSMAEMLATTPRH